MAGCPDRPAVTRLRRKQRPEPVPPHMRAHTVRHAALAAGLLLAACERGPVPETPPRQLSESPFQYPEELPAVRNFTVAVREVGDEVLFLHRLVPGGADRSYGVEVARLAGLPESVVERAREILRELETAAAPPSSQPRAEPVVQLGLFGPPVHPTVERLRAIDANRVTPLQALNLLAELTEAARAG